MMRRLIFTGMVAALSCLVLPSGLTATQEQRREEVLITGLDGGTYEAYRPEVIEEVQKALKAEGLYQGEVTGKLDEATMKAVGEFQKTHDLAVTGVPSPNTRKLLLKQ